MDPAGIDVCGLRREHGRGARAVLAVDGVDLQVARGEIVAVCGPNGAGKTSLLDCVTGLRSVDGGSVRVLGVDPRRHTAGDRARVGVVLPDLGLPPSARAGRVLSHHAGMYARPRPVAELVGALDLADVLGRSVRRLSSGQRQRLAVACALVGRPDVLVLDEPTSALDPAGRRAVLALVAEQAHSGTAVLWSSHTLLDVERAADRVAVLYRGRLLSVGSPSSVTGEEVVRFDAPPGAPLGPLRSALGVGATVREVSAGSYELTGTHGPEALATVASWQAGIGARGGVVLARPSLEDLILRLGDSSADSPTGGATAGGAPARPAVDGRSVQA